MSARTSRLAGVDEREIDRAWAERRAPRRRAIPAASTRVDGRHVTHTHTGTIGSCGAGGRGFGFILGDDGREYFFAAAAVSRADGHSFDDLCIGDRVIFRLAQDSQRRPQARDVSRAPTEL